MMGRWNVQPAMTYERSLLMPGSRFDRWLQGDREALTSEALAGYSGAMTSGLEIAGLVHDVAPALLIVLATAAAGKLGVGAWLTQAFQTSWLGR